MGLFDKFFGKKRDDEKKDILVKPKVASPGPSSEGEFELRRKQLEEFRAQLDEYRNQLDMMEKNLKASGLPEKDMIRQKELLNQHYLHLQRRYTELQDRFIELEKIRGS